MKVIFLDIDGVMNSRFSKVSEHHENLAFDPAAVTALLQLIERTGAKIVVSSTWRLNRSLAELRTRVFMHYGLDGYIIGETPDVPEEPRGIEIQQYLDFNPAVESFVILDDHRDMANLSDYLVQTNPKYGLRSEDVTSAEDILTSRNRSKEKETV